MEVKEKELKVDNIPVVYEFLDVFPKELARSPLQWEIDFEIKLIKDAQPIFKALYWITRIELKELRT